MPELHEQHGVRLAEADDLRDITIALTRAFDDDPMLNWMAQQNERRRHNIARLMAVVVRGSSFPSGGVYTTDDYTGAACWTTPGGAQMNGMSMMRQLPGLVRAVGWRRLRDVMRGLGAVEAKHPKEPHYYLAALGVVPERQGEGIGSRLMEPVLARCDVDGFGAYLESSKERNIPLYERHGFRVRERFEIPHGGPPVWLMWREPRATG